jgi:hypothetical protein
LIWHDTESSRGAVQLRLVLAIALAWCVAAPAAARADIDARVPAAEVTYRSESTQAFTVGVPSGALPGDVLVASLGFGASTAKSQPSLDAPDGWTLATRTDQGSVGALAVYVHVLAAGESSFTWTSSAVVGGVAFVSAYGGVDQASPIDTSSGRTAARGSSVATPSVTTTAANATLVASYYGYRTKGTDTTWTAPTGMTELADAVNASGSRSGTVDSATQGTPGSTGQKTAKASGEQAYAIAALTALRPAQAATTPPAGPPTLSAVRAGSVSDGGATVTWSTDQRADSQVEYGRTASYGSSTALDSTAVTSHSVNVTGLTAGTLYHYRVKSRNAAGQLSVGDDLTFETAQTGAVPLIVDTDIFSDADDVGALATAFGLQLKGEANVIAVVVNTRTSRPAVATNSWKCVAAIDSFYRAASIPIGASTPNNGTSLNDPDFIGPCSRYAPSSTPAPDTAVRVYRRALAAQADGTVVIASAGYFGNLSALLNSPPDDISPLSGRDLVAHKVKTLVAMAGGYPSRFGENNLMGDAAAAQNVAANWPTKLVWSGYEVGDAIHTGQTIPSAHPSTSPVRAAYEAFVRPGNWIYSYDLTAVYHAVRPDDSVLREVGPGTNVVTSTGGNSFTKGSGNQYYLTLSSATSLDASIEALLDTIPSSAPSDTTAPAISGVSQSAGTVSWTTDEPATTQVDYGTTTSYGSQTTLDSSLSTSHRQTLSGLAAGSVYHYRVRSRDAAGNLATSPDATFTTPASADTTPPVISAVSASGGTVSWSTDEPATTQVEYGTTTSYGSQTAPDSSLSTSHRQTLTGLAAGTVYHYRVKSSDAAGNPAASPDATFTTAASTPLAGPNDAFDLDTIDASAWKPTESGSRVAAANQELEITHPGGAWSRGLLVSAPYDQTGRSVSVQLKRAANAGQGGSSYGETGVFLRRDSTHYVYFFAAGGALTAWVNKGSGEANLTSSWPRYSATAMQWLRFRESFGTLYFEYAAGTDAPGPWTTLASTPDPFALTSLTFEMAAGANTSSADVAKFDNVATS